MRKLQFVFSVLMFCGISFAAENDFQHIKNLVESNPPAFSEFYDNFKEVVYSDTVTQLDQVLSMHAKSEKYGLDRIQSAQIDYLVGLYYLQTEDEPMAKNYFEKSMETIKKSIDENPTSEAYTIYAETLSQYTSVLNVTNGLIQNGFKVPMVAKKASDLDSRSAGGNYISACFYIYAPGIFKRLGKGRSMLLKGLENCIFERDDYFNYFISLAYIEIKEKNFSKADEWLSKAEEIFPLNKNLQKSKKYEIKSYAEDVDTKSILMNSKKYEE